MSPKIYTSSIPAVPLHSESLFSHLLTKPSPSLFATRGPGNIGGFEGAIPAFIDAASGAILTRAHLKKLSLSFAYGLLHHPNLAFPPNNPSSAGVPDPTSPSIPLTRGDTIMIFSPNSIAWPVLLYGSIAAGLRTTLANCAYTPRELAWQWTDSGARLVFVTPELITVVREMFRLVGIPQAEGEKRILVIGSDLGWLKGPIANQSARTLPMPWEPLLTLGSLPEEEKFDGRYSHETAFLCYSSGTTGKPKGVETTHNNLTSVLDISMPIFPPLTPGRDIMLGILPFFHIYGVVMLLLFPLHNGIPVVIQTRFDPVGFCANVERYKITMSLVVPPVLVVLSRHEAVEKYDMSTLKLCLSAAAPLGAALAKQVVSRLLALRKGKNQNFVVTQGYGLTETSPVTHLVPEYGFHKVGSIGILLPNLQARIVADDDGNVDATVGMPGELWIKGPTVMKGYLNNGPATCNAITPDGWFKTGDVAVRDSEGYYSIVDRRKELIKYKGFQVPPAELESVLLAHPDIADAAVIGIDDPAEGTELPRAYVVPANPARVKTAAEKAAFGKSVRKWMETRVARHKYLRGGVEVIDVIPKSASGKILRRELRDKARKEVAAKL